MKKKETKEEGVRGVEGEGAEIPVYPVAKTMVETIFPCSPLRI